MLNLRAAVLSVMLCGLVGCAHNDVVHRPLLAPAPINHVVLVKLIDPGQTDELMLECCEWKRSGVGIDNAWVGTHLETGRAPVDGAYDVAFVTAFKSTAEYDRYLNSDWHRALVTKWKPRWASIRIFDIQPEAPGGR